MSGSKEEAKNFLETIVNTKINVAGRDVSLNDIKNGAAELATAVKDQLTLENVAKVATTNPLELGRKGLTALADAAAAESKKLREQQKVLHERASGINGNSYGDQLAASAAAAGVQVAATALDGVKGAAEIGANILGKQGGGSISAVGIDAFQKMFVTDIKSARTEAKKEKGPSTEGATTKTRAGSGLLSKAATPADRALMSAAATPPGVVPTPVVPAPGAART